MLRSRKSRRRSFVSLIRERLEELEDRIEELEEVVGLDTEDDDESFDRYKFRRNHRS